MNENQRIEENLPGTGVEIDGAAPAFEPSFSVPDNMSMLMGVSLKLTVQLGQSQLTVKQVLDLQKGSVVELDRVAGEAVDVLVNDRLIARGDVVVVDDKFGVRITDLISPSGVFHK